MTASLYMRSGNQGQARVSKLLTLLIVAGVGLFSLFFPIAKTQSAESEEPVVLVVAPPVFDQALRPWVEYRQRQGYKIMTLSLVSSDADGAGDMGFRTRPVANPAEIRERIIRVANERQIDSILIIGDGAPTESSKYGWRDVVPAPRSKARVLQVFGSEEHLAGDSWYADFDGDGAPDAPIGRIPAETPAELSRVIEKIIRYESDSPAGNWTRKINIVAGPNGLDLRVIGSAPGQENSGANPLSGLSSLVDSVVDSMARKLFTEYLPQEFSTSITQFSLSSVFCPYPPDFRDAFLERANEGSLFLIYLGHGQAFGLDRYYAPNGREYGIFEIDDCSSLNSPNKAAVACFFACYTGAYDAKWRSLAEEVALSPKGPVAVIAASRRTAPYGMCVLGSALLEAAFHSNEGEFDGIRPRTLGEIYWRAQRIALSGISEESDVAEDEFDEIAEDFFKDGDGETAPSASESGTSDSADNQDDWQYVKRDPLEPGAHLEWINSRLKRSLDETEEWKKKNSSFRKVIDQAASFLDPTASRLDEQIMDHIAEFNLLGDPLLRVRIPEFVSFNAPDISYSSESVPIEGTLPDFNGTEAMVQAELLLADYRTTVRAPERARVFKESEEARREYDDTYRAANKFVVDAVRGKTKDGRFRLVMKIPSGFSGECIIRIAAADGRRYCIGSRRILIRPKTVPIH